MGTIVIIAGARIKECFKSMDDKEFAEEFDLTVEAAVTARQYYEEQNKTLKSCHAIAVAIAKRSRKAEET